MKAHQAYHIEALHLVACDIDALVEVVIEIQELRRIVLKIELLKLDVGIELVDVFFRSDIARFLDERGLDGDTQEP